MRRLVWTPEAWEDYCSWQGGNVPDTKILHRINALITEIQRTPFKGTGKPEPLKYDLAGYWSRRVTGEHRIVYKVTPEDLVIIACRHHY